MNTDAMNQAIAAQEMWNKLQLTENDKATLGAQRMADLTKQINDYAISSAQQQAQQLQLQQITSLVGTVQGMASSLTTGAASDLATAFDKHIPIQTTIGQLPIGEQMKYYTGQMSAQQARNKLAQNQIGNLAREEMFKFGLSTVERGVMGSGSTPGLITPFVQGGMGLAGELLGGVGTFSGNFGSAPTWGFGGGGIVGSGIGPSRYVDMSVFAGAPHFQGGGIAGGEVPIIAHKGEGVFTAAQMKAMGGGGEVHHHYNMQQGDVVIQGDASEKTVALIEGKMAQANKDMMSQLQRNIGTMSGKWGQRYGNT